jgi:hypothetical protein
MNVAASLAKGICFNPFRFWSLGSFGARALGINRLAPFLTGSSCHDALVVDVGVDFDVWRAGEASRGLVTTAVLNVGFLAVGWLPLLPTKATSTGNGAATGKDLQSGERGEPGFGNFTRAGSDDRFPVRTPAIPCSQSVPLLPKRSLVAKAFPCCQSVPL